MRDYATLATPEEPTAGTEKNPGDRSSVSAEETEASNLEIVKAQIINQAQLLYSQGAWTDLNQLVHEPLTTRLFATTNLAVNLHDRLAHGEFRLAKDHYYLDDTPYNFATDLVESMGDNPDNLPELMKIWLKHKVSSEECEEAFATEELFRQPDELHSHKENRYILISKTKKSRLLFIVYILWVPF